MIIVFLTTAAIFVFKELFKVIIFTIFYHLSFLDILSCEYRHSNCGYNGVFYSQAKLLILTLLPTSYSHIFVVIFYMFKHRFLKCEMEIKESVDYIIFSDNYRVKLAFLAFFYCGEFEKISHVFVLKHPM